MPVALFRYGFRPFFLAVGLSGLILVPWWAGSFAWGVPLGTSWPPTLWHAHEMLFGFIGAAIAGFLLTAVPSWTGQRGFAGRPLTLLTGVWLLGRLMVSSSTLWPMAVTAVSDLTFLPALTAMIALPLVRARNRNTPLLIVLVALWACDVAFYRALSRGNGPAAQRALFVGIDIVLVLVTVVGGRILPAFTGAALKECGITAPMRAWPGLTPLAIGSMIAVVITDVEWPESAGAGFAAAVAAAVQLIRLLQWRTLKTLRLPIVWVLHLAYAWLPLGLGLKACALLVGSAMAAFWLHALTIGALTTMIFAVMTRAALGHTGRPLVVDSIIVLAYGLLLAAGLVRVFGLAWLRLGYPVVILVSAAFWSWAFALFVAVYGPILLSPRVDGKPG